MTDYSSLLKVRLGRKQKKHNNRIHNLFFFKNNIIERFELL